MGRFVRKRKAFLAGLLVACALIAAACQVSIPAAPSPAPSETLAPISTSTLTPFFAPTLSSPPAETLPPATATPIVHAVQPGDTLLGLTSEYGVPMAAVQLENGLGESTALYAGEVLVIPPASDWEGASRFWVVHVVKEGETLAEIAGIYDLQVEELLAVNPLADPDALASGDQLVLPLEAPAAAYLPTPTSTPTPVPPTVTATPVRPTVSSPLSPVEKPGPTIAPATLSPGVAGWPHETARLINEVRAAHGLPPYVYNETLARAAQAHADDCIQRGWCSHTGSDGSDVKARIIRAGYEPSGWAECWAQSRDPNHAVEMWMDEEPPNDPHVRTLLSTWVAEIGVGVAQTTWGYYFIADFGRP
jgi:uncharacterized protein YkwD